MDGLARLETWAAPLLQKLAPAARRHLARQIGMLLRRSQAQRIARQENPDGTPYTPRKAPGRLRGKRGRIKRRAMFSKLRTARHLKVRTGAAGVAVGFTGRVARIARVHQEGVRDQVHPGGPTVRYPRRELLGFADADLKMIRDKLIEHLVP